MADNYKKWQFLSISYNTNGLTGDRTSVLQIASPAGSVRSLDLSEADLIRVVIEAANELNVLRRTRVLRSAETST